MSGEGELDALGVTAVDQATIEARVLAQVRLQGATRPVAFGELASRCPCPASLPGLEV